MLTNSIAYLYLNEDILEIKDKDNIVKIIDI